MTNYITKGIGGFYYVKTETGIVECRARGIFRKRGITPVAGDQVVLSACLLYTSPSPRDS